MPMTSTFEGTSVSPVEKELVDAERLAVSVDDPAMTFEDNHERRMGSPEAQSSFPPPSPTKLNTTAMTLLSDENSSAVVADEDVRQLAAQLQTFSHEENDSSAAKPDCCVSREESGSNDADDEEELDVDAMLQKAQLLAAQMQILSKGSQEPDAGDMFPSPSGSPKAVVSGEGLANPTEATDSDVALKSTLVHMWQTTKNNLTDQSDNATPEFVAFRSASAIDDTCDSVASSITPKSAVSAPEVSDLMRGKLSPDDVKGDAPPAKEEIPEPQSSSNQDPFAVPVSDFTSPSKATAKPGDTQEFCQNSDETDDYTARLTNMAKDASTRGEEKKIDDLVQIKPGEVISLKDGKGPSSGLATFSHEGYNDYFVPVAEYKFPKVEGDAPVSDVSRDHSCASSVMDRSPEMSPKSPSSPNSTIWVKCSSAVQGDDDYVPLVDYSSLSLQPKSEARSSAMFASESGIAMPEGRLASHRRWTKARRAAMRKQFLMAVAALFAIAVAGALGMHLYSAFATGSLLSKRSTPRRNICFVPPFDPMRQSAAESSRVDCDVVVAEETRFCTLADAKHHAENEGNDMANRKCKGGLSRLFSRQCRQERKKASQKA